MARGGVGRGERGREGGDGEMGRELDLIPRVIQWRIFIIHMKKTVRGDDLMHVG